ncbi:MAG TPA: M28 family peptidase [Vicinamibacterales bacterium]|nr:M28 family peptidase [Vicinamibacterales bacterium]
MKFRPLYALGGALTAFSLVAQLSAAPQMAAAKTSRGGGAASITPGELQDWLSYIASDELQGRQVYTEGLGLAASYIAEHLKEWGVKPGGDDGSYFQAVKVLGVTVKRNSSVTVTVNGQTRTFKDGEGVTFPANQGGKQTIDGTAEFVGYGLSLPEANINDYKGRDVTGKIVVYVGSRGPSVLTPTQNRLLGARARNAIELQHAVAAIGPAGGFGRGGRGAQAATTSPAPAGTTPTTSSTPNAPAAQPPAGFGGRGGANASLGDFPTVQRLDTKVPPQITAADEFFQFIFSAAGLSYADIKEKIDARDPLPAIALKDVAITIKVDAEYDVVQTRLTRNVVGIVEGGDPRLKDTYVLFGAHYDHIGYQQTPPGQGRGGGFGGGGGAGAGAQAPAPGGCVGQSRDTPKPGDIVNNGADDDGSGTVALMGIAKAFAEGPKPKRSVMFVWHAGEEAGLLGSRYMADYPEVPLDKVSAQLNIDMIGRNRCDQATEANTVYLVGSDRISTELHNVNEDANASLPSPMKLDYEFNDPADPESIYTRSDHYSYASKGIPIIFYTTGLHRDYHYLTDEVRKIEFPKMAHITQLVYTTGWKVANLDHFPVRDNKGPRKGKGAAGKIGG